jgi:hypothetical protein
MLEVFTVVTQFRPVLALYITCTFAPVRGYVAALAYPAPQICSGVYGLVAAHAEVPPASVADRDAAARPTAAVVLFILLS